MTAPTPKGEEPVAVKYVKSITWLAVIILVAIEIFVSIKTGGIAPSTKTNTDGSVLIKTTPSLDELSGLE